MAVPNISLAQFNKIATGDYNAGLVDFKTDDNGNVQNALRKVNHHVHKTGENAINEKNLATVALQTNFATLFNVAYKMHTANAQESETFHLFGLEAKLVKGEDGMLSALLGTGDLQTKVALGENAEMFFSRLVGRTVFDMETLGAPTVKNLLNEVYSHDLEAGILASDRTSVTRQFACLVLENKVDGAFNLCKGNYNTGVLVEIAERVLTNNEEPINTKAKLDAYHAKLVRDNAGLPEEMKAMLEQVANVPLGAPDDDHSEFKVSSPLAAGVDEVQQAIPPPPEGPPPIVHHDRKKVEFAMAMAAQTSKNAVSIGTSIMMDPQGQVIAFTPTEAAGKKKTTWTMTMELGENGDLNISMVGNIEPVAVIFKDGAVEMCGPGSTFKYIADFSFKASELDRISKLDFSEYDNTALNDRIDREKPEQMYEGAIDLIPKKFQLDADIHVDLQSNFM